MEFQFISFFDGLLRSIGDINLFISTPLGTQYEQITMEPFASMSIISLLGTGLVGTLVILLGVHLVRLIVG